MCALRKSTIEDHLSIIIYISKFYYKIRFFKWLSHLCFIFGNCYIILMFYNLMKHTGNVKEQDVIAAAITVEMILAKISLDISMKGLVELEKLRKEQFWPNDLLTEIDRNAIKYFTLQQYLLWCFALMFLINMAIFSITYPEFIYKSYYSSNVKRAFGIWFLFYSTFGYYMGTAAETYFAYTILHCYFQIKVIVYNIRNEFKNYDNIPFKQKKYSELYQKAVHNILKKSIEQYQMLKRYMSIYSAVLNNLAPFHTLAGIPIVSGAIHSAFFNPPPDLFAHVYGLIHFGYGALLYTHIAQIHSEISNVLYIQLTELKWYTFNERNQKLFYMFLIYVQNQDALHLLPNWPIGYPLLTQFIKAVYSVIALLKTLEI